MLMLAYKKINSNYILFRVIENKVINLTFKTIEPGCKESFEVYTPEEIKISHIDYMEPPEVIHRINSSLIEVNYRITAKVGNEFLSHSITEFENKSVVDMNYYKKELYKFNLNISIGKKDSYFLVNLEYNKTKNLEYELFSFLKRVVFKINKLPLLDSLHDNKLNMIQKNLEEGYRLLLWN